MSVRLGVQAPFIAALLPGPQPDAAVVEIRWDTAASADYRLSADAIQATFGEIELIEPEGGQTVIGLDLRGFSQDRILEAAGAWAAQVRPGETVRVVCGSWTSAAVSSSNLLQTVGNAAERAPCDQGAGLATWGRTEAVRRIWVTADAPPPPTGVTGPAHLVNLGESGALPWAEWAGPAGGKVLALPPGERPTLGDLRRAEARHARVAVQFCGTGRITVHRLDAPTARVELPVAGPPCAGVPGPVSSASSGWWLPALGLGGAAATAGLGWWAVQRSRVERERSPERPQPSAGATPSDGRIAGWRIRWIRGGGGESNVVPWPGSALTLGGDATNDLVLSGRGISERHARLERFGSGALFVTDADSTNGTWVEGVRLERGERRLLRPGQRVVLGQDVEFEVLAPEIPS